ncbi:flippase [Roseisolibacter agri]|uniref:O-antigen transporter n=1 Tax=Roseisolibacter agri TaxID=2014610 RepID=A0AA37VFU9_9BACT|nr:flippase [Roseisolibacter agri]GLC27464.1 putative O-antigen transporter [Roseisolibacter agri]
MPTSQLRPERLASGRLLVRNVGLNALGWLLPVVLALGAIPVLVHALGTERFGVLSLAWTMVGYFSLFDLGLGRALTQLVSERLGREAHDELPALTWTALWLMAPLGIAGGLAIALLAPWLVTGVLKIPAALQAESVRAFQILGLAIPFTVSTAGFRGILEATQDFARVNALRVPLALLTFLGPLAVLPWSATLPATVGVLALGRALLWWAHVVQCRRAFPPVRHVVAPHRAMVRPLLAVGGWMTVSNVVSPLMYSLDRFAVSAVLSIAAVTYYATAYEAVTRLWIVTSVLLPVLFPALAVAVQRDRAQAALLLDRGGRAGLLAVFPAALAIIALAPEWLGVWLGADFARHAAPLAQGLAVAVFINIAGQIAYTLLQATGRADVTGKLHLVELVPYLGALWALLHGLGAVGVVVAWGARVAFDTAALLWMGGRVVPEARVVLRRLAVLTLVGTPLLLLPAFLPTRALRVAYAVAALVAFAVVVWTRLVAPDERALVQAMMRARVRRGAPAVTDAA